MAAVEVEPAPELAPIYAIYRDSINGQNGNGFWEPGETIEILPLIKNYWGPTDDVRVGIEFAEFEDTSKATIVQDEIQIGSISAYATLQDLYETLKLQLMMELLIMWILDLILLLGPVLIRSICLILLKL